MGSFYLKPSPYISRIHILQKKIDSDTISWPEEGLKQFGQSQGGLPPPTQLTNTKIQMSQTSRLSRAINYPPPLSNLSVRTRSAKWFLQRGLHHTHTYSDGLRYECKHHLIFSASASTKGRTKSKSILPALFKCSSTKTDAIPATNFFSSCPSSACKPATEVAAIWKIHSLQIQKALISKIP